MAVPLLTTAAATLTPRRQPNSYRNPASGAITAPAVQTAQATRTEQNPLTKSGMRTSVSFQPNGRVVYGVGGNTYDLSAKEYQAVLNKGGGLVTPQVESLRETEARERIAADTRRNVAVADVQKQTLNEQKTGLIPSELQTPIEQQTAAANSRNIEQEQKSGISENVGGFIDEVTKPKLVKDILGGLAKIVSSASSILPDMLQVGTKKTTPITQAENTFNELTATISNDIELAKMGLADPNKTLKDINLAIEAISRLEAQTRGLGKANLRYWIDEGKELESSIMNEKSSLEGQRIQILALMGGL